MTSPELTQTHAQISLSRTLINSFHVIYEHIHIHLIWFVSHTRDIVWWNCIISTFAYIIIIIISYVHAKWTSNLSSARDFIDFWKDFSLFFVVRLGGFVGGKKIIIGRCAFSIFMHKRKWKSCCWMFALKGHF